MYFPGRRVGVFLRGSHLCNPCIPICIRQRNTHSGMQKNEKTETETECLFRVWRGNIRNIRKLLQKNGYCNPLALFQQMKWSDCSLLFGPWRLHVENCIRSGIHWTKNSTLTTWSEHNRKPLKHKWGASHDVQWEAERTDFCSALKNEDCHGDSYCCLQLPIPEC